MKNPAEARCRLSAHEFAPKRRAEFSVFDLFKIGIGPSSSHTVGPMKAASRFAAVVEQGAILDAVDAVVVELYGSLADTGRGHGTDGAILLGLEGALPESVDIDMIDQRPAEIRKRGVLRLAGKRPVAFEEAVHFRFHYGRPLPRHPNAMRFSALDSNGGELLTRTYYSVGGGFIVGEGEQPQACTVKLPYSFSSARELLEICRTRRLSISDVMLENESAWRPAGDVEEGLLGLWRVMEACVARGCSREGVLPGALKLKRRAPGIFRQLTDEAARAASSAPLGTLDWVNLFALAASEENAAGGRVVTAPTNGAAGIIPAVLHYYVRFCANADDRGVIRFLLTAGAVGMLYKLNASISGAEVGCQGEVGVASSMAAAGLAEVLGGTPEQVENAAEIAMEHNLGLTCDPVAGLVQVPCIERNAMGAVKAINAARLSLRGDGTHFVSLDQVIRTMEQTGADMKTKYKETARGGLAVNVIEC